jgi:hypothetical protein
LSAADLVGERPTALTDLASHAALLCKRFERLKQRLCRMASSA